MSSVTNSEILVESLPSYMKMLVLLTNDSDRAIFQELVGGAKQKLSSLEVTQLIIRAVVHKDSALDVFASLVYRETHKAHAAVVTVGVPLGTRLAPQFAYATH